MVRLLHIHEDYIEKVPLWVLKLARENSNFLIIEHEIRGDIREIREGRSHSSLLLPPLKAKGLST